MKTGQSQEKEKNLRGKVRKRMRRNAEEGVEEEGGGERRRGRFALKRIVRKMIPIGESSENANILRRRRR